MNSYCTSEFRARVEMLARYSQAVEGFLAAEAHALEAEVERGMLSRPVSEQQDYFEAYLDDILEMADDLPSLLRFSVITMLDGALEHMLNEICDAYVEMLSLSLTRAEVVGAPLERARIYLRKVVGLPFPDQTREWAGVVRFRELRNACVHANGEVRDGAKALRQWVQGTPGLSLSNRGSVKMEAAFIIYALDLYRRFGDQVDGALAGKPLTGFQSGFEVVSAEAPKPEAVK